MSRIICSHWWMTLNASDGGNPFVTMTPEDGAMVVALTDQDEVLITVERSPAYQQEVRYLPGGGIEAGEDAAESANRELQEEAGLKAARLDYVGVVAPFIKYMRSKYVVYLARDLQPNKLEGDEGYDIGVERMPMRDLDQWAADGRLQDACVISALYLARAFLQKERQS
jgi:ADP-ribose diphosphatase